MRAQQTNKHCELRGYECRKLKKDLVHELTESSASGIALSVIAAVFMIALVRIAARVLAGRARKHESRA